MPSHQERVQRAAETPIGKTYRRFPADTLGRYEIVRNVDLTKDFPLGIVISRFSNGDLYVLVQGYFDLRDAENHPTCLGWLVRKRAQ